MKKLIVAATLEEISLIFDHFAIQKNQYVETPEVDFLITGVGMTATAFSLGQHLHNNYSLVLNLGIAGTFDRSLSLGTVVNVKSDTFAELGAEDNNNFLSIDEMGFGKSTYIPRSDQTYVGVDNLKSVRGVTVNKVHGNSLSIENLIKRLDPEIESMEGAAVFYCCEKMSIPAIQVRAISNYVEPRNKDNWKIGLAVKNLNAWAIDFLTNS
jgi:futalosine hydrolase